LKFVAPLYFGHEPNYKILHAARRMLRILRRDPCVYCGGPANTTEHIRSRSEVRGRDRDEHSNLASACASCNQAKGTTPLLLFLRTHWQ
jgi:5-methylcytosine-specific restriction endonuclease McrA